MPAGDIAQGIGSSAKVDAANEEVLGNRGATFLDGATDPSQNSPATRHFASLTQQIERLALKLPSTTQIVSQGLKVPARRTRHIRFNDLNDPGPIAEGTSYASIIQSDT